MRFRLRTLLIVLALGPPLLALGWKLSTLHGDRKITDFALALGLVGALLLMYFVACLIAGFLVASLISAVNWLIGKIQGHE